VSPFCAYYATNVPKLYVRAAYRIANPAGRATGQLFWQAAGDTAFSEGRSYRFPIVVDEQFHTYELALSASNSYAGLITWLRFDPAISGGSGDYADVAWISPSPIGAAEPGRMRLAMAQTDGAAVLSFPTVSDACLSQEGHHYLHDLQWRTSLLSGGWQDVPGWSGIVGDGATRTFTNPAPATATFFRVRVRLE
jgi:hypothetical protein